MRSANEYLGPRNMLTPIGLDIDGSVAVQSALVAELQCLMNLEHLENDIRLWSSEESWSELKGQIAALKSDLPGAFLTFIGSGDFHHVTLALLEQNKNESVTLVLIDNHPDWFREAPRYHCGNWVASALELPCIEEVIIVGPDSSDLSGYKLYTAPVRELRTGKLSIYPYRRRMSFMPGKRVLGNSPYVELCPGTLGTTFRFSVVEEVGIGECLSRLGRRLDGRKVYLSIDKDCLRPEEAVTDWEQGKLRLVDLEKGLGELLRMTQIVGADIVGERALRPLRGLRKRADALRFRTLRSDRAIVALNQRTNLSLLNCFRNYLRGQEAEVSHGDTVISPDHSFASS